MPHPGAEQTEKADAPREPPPVEPKPDPTSSMAAAEAEAVLSESSEQGILPPAGRWLALTCPPAGSPPDPSTDPTVSPALALGPSLASGSQGCTRPCFFCQPGGHRPPLSSPQHPPRPVLRGLVCGGDPAGRCGESPVRGRRRPDPCLLLALRAPRVEAGSRPPKRLSVCPSRGRNGGGAGQERRRAGGGGRGRGQGRGAAAGEGGGPRGERGVGQHGLRPRAGPRGPGPALRHLRRPHGVQGLRLGHPQV